MKYLLIPIILMGLTACNDDSQVNHGDGVHMKPFKPPVVMSGKRADLNPENTEQASDDGFKLSDWGDCSNFKSKAECVKQARKLHATGAAPGGLRATAVMKNVTFKNHLDY